MSGIEFARVRITDAQRAHGELGGGVGPMPREDVAEPVFPPAALRLHLDITRQGSMPLCQS